MDPFHPNGWPDTLTPDQQDRLRRYEAAAAAIGWDAPAAGAWASRRCEALGARPCELVEASEEALQRVLAELQSWRGRPLNPGEQPWVGKGRRKGR